MQKRLVAFAILLMMPTLLCPVARTEQPKKAGEFFGRVFFDYFHDFSSSEIDPSRIAPAGQKNGFEFTRIYFGYDREIAENFSIRFLMDVDNTKDDAGNSAWRPFMKNAYLAVNCRIVEGSKWYIGMISMPLVGVPESHWKYRALYKLPMDITGWGNTADIGIGWKGMWQDKYQLEFALANGAGYKNAETDMFKLIELRPTAYLLEKALTVSLFGSFEALNDSSNALIFAAMAGFDHRLFRVGGEFSTRSVFKGYVNENGKAAELSQNNISVWVHGKPAEKITILARYDIYEPNTGVSDDKNSALIAGLDFHPAQNVHFIPNVQLQMNERDNNSATPYDESKSQNTFYITFEYGW